METLTFGSNKEVARASRVQTSDRPDIVGTKVELVFMSDGTILKRRCVHHAKKENEYESTIKVYPWQVKRKAMSYPFVTQNDFIEGFRARGYDVEVQPS
jgi:hypothetical protein